MSYPALTQLAQAYFHQDFQEDYDTPMSVVDDFLERSDYRGLIGPEIQRALAEYSTEDETRWFVQEVLDCMYLPEADGLTYRGWLRSVADRARDRLIP